MKVKNTQFKEIASSAKQVWVRDTLANIKEFSPSASQSRIANKQAQIEKLTTEMLQPWKTDFKSKLGVETPADGIVKAGEIIKKAKTFKDVDVQFKNVANQSINIVKDIIKKNPEKKMDVETFMKPTKDIVQKLSKETQKEWVAAKQIYQDRMLAEIEWIKKNGNDWMAFQTRKMEYNEMLNKFFSKDQSQLSPIEQANVQSMNAIREWYMKAIEWGYWKDVWIHNRIYWDMISVRKMIANEARTAGKTRETGFIKAASKKFVQVRAVLSMSPFLSSMIWSLTPAELIWPITKQITKLKGEIKTINNPKELKMNYIKWAIMWDIINKHLESNSD